MTLPLLLIPGIASDGSVWRAMPPGQVIMCDEDTIEAMARRCLARAPHRFALAGHSMGGYVALAMVALAPERVARLALLSTAAVADDPAHQARRASLIAAAERDYGKVAALLLAAMLHPDAQGDQALASEMTAMIQAPGAARFIRQQRAVMARPDRTAALAAITAPTLVLAGEADRVVSPAQSVEMAGRIPHARLVMIPRCGHVPQREAPEVTSNALYQWLGEAGA